MGNSYVSWGAILAGAVVSGAISLIFLHFGAGIGLAATLDGPRTTPVTGGMVITIGLWLIWVAVISGLTGGYVSGRLRTPATEATAHEREVRDGMHGAVTWAFATVVTLAAASLVSALAALAPQEAAEAINADVVASEKTATVILSFCTSAGALISGVASWWAATLGGDHRDSGVDLSRHLSFRRIVVKA